MPRPGPVRPSVTLRLDAETIAYLDAAAKRVNVTRSDLIRRAVQIAVDDNRKRRNTGERPWMWI